MTDIIPPTIDQLASDACINVVFSELCEHTKNKGNHHDIRYLKLYFRLLCISLFTFFFMGMVGTVIASPHALTKEEIHVFFLALESAKTNNKIVNTTLICMEAEDKKSVAIREKLQNRAGELKRKNNNLETEVRSAKSRVEEYEKLLRSTQKEKEAAKLKFNRIKSKLDSAKKRLSDCNKSWTSSLGACDVVGFINDLNASYNGHHNKYESALRKYKREQDIVLKSKKDVIGATTRHKDTRSELEQIKNQIQDNAVRLSNVKSNLSFLREKSGDFEKRLENYRIALREAQGLDLQSTRGRVARKVRQEHWQLLNLQKNSAELLAGNGIQLSAGALICKINKTTNKGK